MKAEARMRRSGCVSRRRVERDEALLQRPSEGRRLRSWAGRRARELDCEHRVPAGGALELLEPRPRQLHADPLPDQGAELRRRQAPEDDDADALPLFESERWHRRCTL